MKYSNQEVMQYVKEEDVKFIRLAFCDVYGVQKNISIMPHELQRAFEYGIAIDASAIEGFEDEVHSDLFLHPDPSTIAILPWRPEHGRVVRMYCNITHPDNTPYTSDSRSFLQKAVEDAKKQGYTFYFGAEMEFYLFRLDEYGKSTKEPYDYAKYMDIAPDDRGENVRREICLTLEQMGISPESSHHEEGPGQNEIDFRYSHALSAGDNAVTFKSVVKTVASRNGLFADFSPKPLENQPGNGFHINMSIKRGNSDEDLLPLVIPSILEKARDMAVFLNPCPDSYKRLGADKAPQYISWSRQNRSQLIRIPAAVGEYKRLELRSPDPTANPYLAFGLMIYASLDGLKKKDTLPDPADINLFTANNATLAKYEKLPSTLDEAKALASNSQFIKAHLPQSLIDAYCKN